MDDTDFDLLYEGASVQEAKRLRKLLSEWCDGDENSFPVQLALLTRAQWRTTARIPRLVNESRNLLEREILEYRQQMAVLVKSFADTADAKAKTLQNIVTTHTQATKDSVAEIRGKFTSAERIAEHIKEELGRGAFEWNKAKTEFETERQNLERIRRELETRINLRDWLCYGLVMALIFGIGLTAGWYFARL